MEPNASEEESLNFVNSILNLLRADRRAAREERVEELLALLAAREGVVL